MYSRFFCFLILFMLIPLLLTGCMETQLRQSGEFPPPGSMTKEMLHPTDIDVDDDGNIYVCDTGNNRVVKFSSDGTYMTEFSNKMKNPQGICVQNSMVYVADTGNNRILIYTSTGGAKRVITGSKLGQSSDKKNRLYMPRDVAVDDDNMVYVIDSKHRLLIFDASGNLKQQFGSKGKALNQFNHANSIAITPFLDENRKLYYYIADTLNKRVLKFSKTNKLIFAANEKGVMETMNDPRGVAVTENGDFFVADTGRIPVVAYKSNGVISAIAGVFGAGKGKILKPGGIAYSKTNNKIYVTDTLQNKILVYSVK